MPLPMSGKNNQMVGVSNITNRTDPNSLKSRVFVGNLNTVHMTKTELEAIFAKYGAIIGISVHKGYAFIQYGNEASARSAVAGEDSKVYYSMALDVTIASEPKNRKRGRSNVNATISAWPGFSSTAIPDLTLQAQALSSLASNPVLSSLQQLGLEGIMGQPNFSQFAAAATSVLGSAAPLTGYTFGAAQAPVLSNTRPKHTRSSTSQSSFTPVSTLTTSSSAKRTRLENQNTFGHGSSNLNLPAGARGQNLVSLVSPSDGTASNRSSKTSAPAQRQSDNGVSVPHTRPSASGARATTPTNVTAPKRPIDNNSVASVSSLSHSEDSGRLAADDILICGNCRRLFDQVDELISHKMAGCSLNQATCQSCRCRAGEPELLECAYCGAAFHSAWDLMHHCHDDHGLTIYTIPSPRSTPPTSRNNSSTPSLSGKKNTSGSRKPHESNNEQESHMAGDLKFSPEDSYIQVGRHQPHEDAQEGSDWERDPDEYAVESEALRHNEENENSGEHQASRSPSCSPVRSIEDSNPNSVKEEPSSPTAMQTILSSKPVNTSDEQSHGHRRRGGEYGRHETMADDEDAIDDDEEPRSNAVRND